MSENVLVTGGAGFIGSYVCESLLNRGYDVVVLDNLDSQVHGKSQKWPEYLPHQVKRIKGDIRDRSVVKNALNGCRYVIHLAAAVGVGQSMYKIQHYVSVNVLGTSILLEEIVNRKDQIKKLVVASSMSVYGEGAYSNSRNEKTFPKLRDLGQMKAKRWEFSGSNSEELIPVPTDENKPLCPSSVYAISKRDQEEMCLCVGKAYDIPTVAMRMFNVYGPRQALSNPYTGVVAIFCSQLIRGKQPTIYEDGQQRRDFVHVEDVAHTYLRVLESSAVDGMAVNVGSGRSISVNEIAETLMRVLDVDIAPIVTGNYREGDIRHCFADISLIKNKLNFNPNNDFKRGITGLVDWLKKQQVSNNGLDSNAELKKRGLLI